MSNKENKKTVVIAAQNSNTLKNEDYSFLDRLQPFKQFQRVLEAALVAKNTNEKAQVFIQYSNALRLKLEVILCVAADEKVADKWQKVSEYLDSKISEVISEKELVEKFNHKVS